MTLEELVERARVMGRDLGLPAEDVIAEGLGLVAEKFGAAVGTETGGGPRAVFLKALASGDTAVEAATKARVSLRTVYEVWKKDGASDFEGQFRRAQLDGRRARLDRR